MPNVARVALVVASVVLRSSLLGQGTSAGMLSERVEYVAFFRSRTQDMPIDVILILRGATGWRRAGQSGYASSGRGMSAVGRDRPITYSFRMGSVAFESSYEPQRRVVRIWGEEYQLNSANVLVMDRIDSVGGPPVVRLLTLILPRADQAAQLAELLPRYPELQEFFR